VVESAVRINATDEAKTLATKVEILAEAVKEGKVKVVAARYDIASGRVEILP
jgi:carbonic anhydrase